MIARHTAVFDPILAGRLAQLVGKDGEPPGAGLWRGTARLQLASGASGPSFPWAVAELPVLAALAGLEVGNRHCEDRCFLELRHVSGR